MIKMTKKEFINFVKESESEIYAKSMSDNSCSIWNLEGELFFSDKELKQNKLFCRRWERYDCQDGELFEVYSLTRSIELKIEDVINDKNQTNKTFILIIDDYYKEYMEDYDTYICYGLDQLIQTTIQQCKYDGRSLWSLYTIDLESEKIIEIMEE